MLDLDARLRALARTLVSDDSLADDVVQDAWVAILGRPRGAVHTVRGWMAGVVRNRAAEHARKQRRRSELEELMAARDATVPPDDSLASRESIDVLSTAIDALREPYRTTLRLRFFDHLEVAEIAVRTGRNASTVRSQLSRGVAELRAKLDERHGGRSEWRLAVLPLAGRPDAPPRAATATAASSRVAAWVVGLLVLIGVVALGVRIVRADAAPVESETATVDPLDVARGEADRDATSPVVAVESVDPGRSAAAAQTDPAEEDDAPDPAAPVAGADVVASIPIEVVRADGLPAVNPRVGFRAQQYFVRQENFDTNPFVLDVRETDIAGGEVDNLVSFSVADEDIGEGWSKTILVDLDRFDASAGPLRLTTRGPASTVGVRVLGPDGEPVQNAAVTLKGTGSQGRTELAAGVSQIDIGWLLYTREDGFAFFSRVPFLPRELTVRAPGFVPVVQSVEIDEEIESLELTLVAGGLLRGVARLPDGSPAADARVRSIEVLSARITRRVPEARTDAEGRYELVGLRDGKQHVFVEAGADADGVPLVAWTIADVPVGEERTWDARAAPHHGVTLLLLDDDGEPLRGMTALVCAQDDGPRGMPPFVAILESDDEGFATFPLVPDIDLCVMVSRGPSDTPVVARGLRIAPDALHFEAIDVPRPPGGGVRITGLLLDPEGEPVQNAQVRDERSGDHRYVDVDPVSGRFEFVDALAGRHHLLAFVTGRGLVDLGTHEAAPGEAIELGETRIAATIPMAFDWGQIVPSPTDPWSITYGTDDNKGRLYPVLVLDAPVEVVDLLPGEYVLTQDSSKRELRFVAEPGAGPVAPVIK